MVRVKLCCGLSIGILYLWLQFGILPGQSDARKAIIAKEVLSNKEACGRCGMIIGGSNVIYGIQSKVVANDIGSSSVATSVKNLALMSEGFDFSNYVSWLSHFSAAPSFIIYSTIKVYFLNRSHRVHNENVKLDGDPRIGFFSSERLINKLWGRTKLLDFDQFGDLRSYECDGAIYPIDFESFDEQAADLFLGDVQVLLNMYANSKIFLRIPPAYVRAEEKRDWDRYFALLESYGKKRGIDGLFLSWTPPL